MENKIINKAKEYAIRKHMETNHEYDGKVYETHLQMVYDFACKYTHLLPSDIIDDVLSAAWTHDIIEDCRETYNDVKNNLNENIAEITYALTNEKGKTRSERANENYYHGLRMISGATYLKVCDRMANVQYSKSTNSSMFDRYKKENESFDLNLRIDHLNEMFDDLLLMFE